MLCKYLTLEPAAVFGGTNLRVQAAEIASGCDIVVGTPGRLLDLIYHGALNVRYIRKLVIDEVDEMLALGFRPQLERLFDLLPEKRQNILVSATISEDVEFILGDYFNAPERVEAAPPGTPLSKIRQGLFRVPNFNTKINLLGMLLEQQKEMERVLIFVSTKALADDLFQKLIEMQPGKIGVIHSNKDQNTRFLAVRKFKEGEIRILIATDIIARGIDITDVSHVINFDLPDEPQQYIHRIGRTGRADKEGVAYSLVGDQDIEKLPEIEAMMHYSVPSLPLPDNLVFSDVLTEAEIPRIHMKNLLGKVPELRDTKRAFHDRKDKNKKTNIKVSHKEKMQAKYGKPKTRGQKRK
jgi:ATP-dependent RNA helicase RhlE